MAVASVEWSESNLAGPTVTDGISNINFGSNESANIVVATYPITTGTNSYHKAIRFHCSNMGTSNKLDNFQFWKSAGTLMTEETLVWLMQVAYVRPVTTSLGATGCPTADPGSSNVTPAAGLSAVGYSDYIHLQVKSTTNTEAGNANQLTFTLQYDEQ